jgi:hypothetical protein
MACVAFNDISPANGNGSTIGSLAMMANREHNGYESSHSSVYQLLTDAQRRKAATDAAPVEQLHTALHA